MSKIAFAICSKSETQYAAFFAEDMLVVPELKRLGIEVVTADWRDRSVDWCAFDAVIIRSTWDYVEHLGEFKQWLESLQANKVRVWNPVPVLLGNIDKLYLRALEQRGVPIVPTAWLIRGNGADQSLAQAIVSLQGDDFILKPTVSAGAYQTYRFKRTEASAHQKSLREILERSDAMVQTFIPEVLTEGEWSFLFFGGEYSHAILKTPKQGDFRVQATFGASTTPKNPELEWIELARSVVQKSPGPLLYARVDMIRHRGKLLLGELELAEPCLFLSYDPEAPSRFAEAIKVCVQPNRSNS